MNQRIVVPLHLYKNIIIRKEICLHERTFWSNHFGATVAQFVLPSDITGDAKFIFFWLKYGKNKSTILLGKYFILKKGTASVKDFITSPHMATCIWGILWCESQNFLPSPSLVVKFRNPTLSSAVFEITKQTETDVQTQTHMSARTRCCHSVLCKCEFTEANKAMASLGVYSKNLS